MTKANSDTRTKFKSFLKVMDFVVKSNEDEWKLELDKINEKFQVNYDKNNLF